MPFKKNTFTKRKADITPLGEAIEEMLSAFKIKSKVNETKLIESWESTVGKPIASRTTDLKIKYKKLYVTLNSAPLKQELLMSKTKLLEILNRDYPEKVVEDIVFL